MTFETKGDANTWLALQHADIVRDQWAPAQTSGSDLTFAAYANGWLEHRQLKPRSKAEYRRLLDHHLLPTYGSFVVRDISRERVREWYSALDPEKPTQRARAYGLLRTIMSSAVSDGIIGENPVHIRGAGNVRRKKVIKPASVDELEVLVSAVPPRYRAMLLLAAWCAVRFGELTELRRADLDLEQRVVRVRRGVVRVNGDFIVQRPKSEAGVRDVAIPPHLIPALQAHLREHVGPAAQSLLFPAADGARHMAPSTLYKVFYKARAAAGRDDLRPHDLRHTGAVLAASTGATLAELMARLGHSTPGAALLYQHAVDGRDAQIAQALSGLVMSGQERPGNDWTG